MAVVPDDGVEVTVTANAGPLVRLARRHSLCEDDAADACQHTLELYLTRRHRLEPATVAGWLRTVCKHEAMRIRAARLRILTPEAVEWDDHPSVDVGDTVDRLEAIERVARVTEALSACVPDEARAMLLRADGSTYQEISEACGRTVGQVSRSLAAGRLHFQQRYAAIESGAMCERVAPVLRAIVAAAASPDDFLAVRPHLRQCAGCRGTLRALYDFEPERAESAG